VVSAPRLRTASIQVGVATWALQYRYCDIDVARPINVAASALRPGWLYWAGFTGLALLGWLYWAGFTGLALLGGLYWAGFTGRALLGGLYWAGFTGRALLGLA
jgi:hypothetical protein